MSYYNDLNYDAYLADQISLSVTRFECEDCGGEFPFSEQDSPHTCKACAAKDND